jgi:hypothetical protein
VPDQAQNRMMRRTSVFLLLLACPAALCAQESATPPTDPAPQTAQQSETAGPADATAKGPRKTGAKAGPPDAQAEPRKPRVFGGSRIRYGRRTNGLGVQLPF